LYQIPFRAKNQLLHFKRCRLYKMYISILYGGEDRWVVNFCCNEQSVFCKIISIDHYMTIQSYIHYNKTVNEQRMNWLGFDLGGWVLRWMGNPLWRMGADPHLSETIPCLRSHPYTSLENASLCDFHLIYREWNFYMLNVITILGQILMISWKCFRDNMITL
jgi:hypothetical protein